MAFIFLIYPYLETLFYPFTRALHMCFTFCNCPFFHLPPLLQLPPLPQLPQLPPLPICPIAHLPHCPCFPFHFILKMTSYCCVFYFCIWFRNELFPVSLLPFYHYNFSLNLYFDLLTLRTKQPPHWPLPFWGGGGSWIAIWLLRTALADLSLVLVRLSLLIVTAAAAGTGKRGLILYSDINICFSILK